MKKLIYICKDADEVAAAKKNSTLKIKSIAQLIIFVSAFIAFWIIAEDLIYVLDSNGLWNIFGQKLVISFIALVALIATVNGKIGVDTQWMHNNHIILDLKALGSLVANIAGFISILIILGVIYALLSYGIENHKKIISNIKDKIARITTSEHQYNVNQIAKTYKKIGEYKTNVKTTLHNGNVYTCEPADEAIFSDVNILTKSLNYDKFVSMTYNTSDESNIVWNNIGNNQYLSKQEIRILSIMDNNIIMITDSNKTSYQLLCNENLKANN